MSKIEMTPGEIAIERELALEEALKMVNELKGISERLKEGSGGFEDLVKDVSEKISSLELKIREKIKSGSGRSTVSAVQDLEELKKFVEILRRMIKDLESLVDKLFAGVTELIGKI